MEILPVELVEMISSHLTVQELAACCAVSHGWRDVFNQDLLWRHLCDTSLEEYLRTTPAIVEPFFVSPESEGSTLSPVCQWRLAFMRENHLWNNWRTGNYKTQVIETKGSESFFNYSHYGFLTNDYVVIVFGDKIELWDVTKEKASKVSETFQYLNDSRFLIAGNSNEFFVLVNQFDVQVFGMDANRQIVMKCMFLIDLDGKIPNEALDLVKSKITLEIDFSKVLCYCVVGAIFLLIMERNFHIWDLETGQKLKNEQCPLDMSHSVFKVIHSKTRTEIVVVATSAEASKLIGVFKETYFYFVYSITSLAFLPFTQKSEDSLGFDCCLYDRFVGISDSGGIRVYNFKNSNLLFQITGTRLAPSKLVVVNNNFVFHHDEKLKMFHTSNKTFKSFSHHEVYDFRNIGGRFLELVTDNDVPNLNRVWEFGDFLSFTEIVSSCILKVNRACTRLIFEKDPWLEDFDEEPKEELEILLQHFW